MEVKTSTQSSEALPGSIAYESVLGRWRRSFIRPSVDKEGNLLKDVPKATVTVTYTFDADKANYHLDSTDGVHRDYNIVKVFYDAEKHVFYGEIKELDGTSHGWAAIHFREVKPGESITLCKCGTSGGAPTKEGVPETWSRYTEEQVKARVPERFYTYAALKDELNS